MHEVGQLPAVGDHHEHSFLLLLQFQQELADPGGRGAIEIARRLVRQEQEGPVDQGSGQCRPLAFTAGQLRGPVIEAVAQSDPIQQFLRPLDSLGKNGTGGDRRHEHILQDRALRQEVVVLKNKADGAVAKLGQLRLGKGGRVLVVQEHPPGSRRLQRAQNIQQGALARAAGTHDRHVLAARQIQRNSLQHDQWFAARGELLDNVLNN